jgi:hypothetical protein
MSINKYMWGEFRGGLKRKYRRNRSRILNALIFILFALIAFNIARHYWRISTPEVFWPALEALVVTFASVTIIIEIRGLRGNEMERAAKGFMLFAEKFMVQFENEAERLSKVITLPLDKRVANEYDIYAQKILERLEVAQSFIERGLMDREIFFLSYMGNLSIAASSIRHLLHNKVKMPWLKEGEIRYWKPLNLIFEFEDWESDRKGTLHLNN